MNNCVLFIQGGGDEGYDADKKLVVSFTSGIGKNLRGALSSTMR